MAEFTCPACGQTGRLMVEPAYPYEHRVLRIPGGTDIDGAIVQLHFEGGLVTMDIRIPARDAGEDWIRDAMAEAHDHPGRVITR